MTVIRLFTPGPTMVPESVRAAEAEPMIHHRSPEFERILKKVRESLVSLCDTDGEVLVFTSSGTGGMEAAVSSLFAAGDEVIVVEGGKFGERWVDLAQQYGLKANVIHVEWGRAVSPAEIQKALSDRTRGVFMQACESSTGVYHPVAEIGRLLKDRDVLFVVDAITALGVHDLSMKWDRIDVLLGASQKALMSAPGLATVGLSPRAIAQVERSKPRSYYFSLARELKAARKGTTSFTPAISLVRSMNTALEMIEKEGKEKVFARHKRLQAMARAALREDGLDLFNRDDEATCGITTVRAPDKIDLKKWLKELKEEHGLWLAGGQGELEGKIFRLSHMGACQPNDLLGAIETIETSLAAHYPAAARHAGLEKARRL